MPDGTSTYRILGLGGNDEITAGDGLNILMGGVGGDRINGGNARDIVLGDNGVAFFTEAGVLVRIETIDPEDGGSDTILSSDGDDIVLGGSDGDIVLAATHGDDASLDEALAAITAGDLAAIDQGDDAADIVLGDNGYANFSDSGLLLDIQTSDPVFGGSDILLGGNGPDIIFGGSFGDIIAAGEDDAADIALGDNGRATFQGTETFDVGEEFSTLSFNFNAANADTTVNGDAGTQIAAGTFPVARAGNWNNMSGATGLFGDEAGEIVVFDDGEIAPGISVEWSAQSTDTHSQIGTPNPVNDDQRLFEGYLTASTDNSVGVSIDGLAEHYAVFDVYVYLDADDGNSAAGTSVRTVSAGTQSFALNDPDGNTFNGTYNDATGDGAGNYVVFTGLTAADLVNGKLEILVAGATGANRPAISAVQVVGQSNPIDRIESTDPEYAGDDIILTGGGQDVAIGGTGNDLIETFGAADHGSVDRDIVAGDNGRVTFMISDTSDLRKFETTFADLAGVGLSFDDLIRTGNGEDIVLGGSGKDEIETGITSESRVGALGRSGQSDERFCRPDARRCQ